MPGLRGTSPAAQAGPVTRGPRRPRARRPRRGPRHLAARLRHTSDAQPPLHDHAAALRAHGPEPADLRPARPYLRGVPGGRRGRDGPDPGQARRPDRPQRELALLERRGDRVRKLPHPGVEPLAGVGSHDDLRQPARLPAAGDPAGGKRRPDGRGDDLFRCPAGPAPPHRGGPGRRCLPAGRGRGADRRAGARARGVGGPGVERRRRSRPGADPAAADGRLAGQQLRTQRAAAGLRNLHPGPGRGRGPRAGGLRGPRAGGAGRAGPGAGGRRADPGRGDRFAAAAGAVPHRRAGRRRRTGRGSDHAGSRRREADKDSSLGGVSRA